MKDITNFIIGMFLGAFFTIFIMMLDTPKQIDIIDNMSLCPPKELPQNTEGSVKLPENLVEVIL